MTCNILNRFHTLIFFKNLGFNMFKVKITRDAYIKYFIT